MFVYGALQYDRPFLASLFACKALHPVGVTRKLPLCALVVLRWLRGRLRKRRSRPLRRWATIDGATLRVDAKAEGLAVAVGGRAPHFAENGQVDVGRSRWFSVRPTEQDAPWAFVGGRPARAISTLELLATTLGHVLLAPAQLDAPGAAGTVAATGLTDNQFSAAVVTRGLNTSFPLCTVAMELPAQLEARGAELFLSWIPRKANREAGRLADGRWEGFDEKLRVHTNLSEVNWLDLNDLLKAGQAFYAEGRRADGGEKQARAVERGVAGKRRKLREREPW